MWHTSDELTKNDGYPANAGASREKKTLAPSLTK
jgi:hypothetical protein